MTALTLEQAAELPPEAIGGKARGLARLAALGLPVPPARVLDVSVHDAFLASGRVPDVAVDLGWPLAVRSSAADEDAADRSAAGQYESVMGVRDAAGLRAAIEHCYHAADSARVRSYRGDGVARVALVLQQSIAAQRAGVAFSVDPVTGAHGDVLVEAVFGHGEGLVSGELNPDRYWVGDTVRARRADKGSGERRWARVLRDDEARRIAELTLTAEAGFGTPVDVEFCWAGPELWLVQCRPITALA